MTNGWVAPGFEAVSDAFAKTLPQLGTGGGAFAAYVEGRPVVDLWGGSARPGQPWAEDTLVVMMSATKGLVAMCAQVLVDRDALDIDARVADYWPEFAQAGKHDVTVRQILTHTAGVLSFEGHGELLQWDGSGWTDYDAIAAGLAAAAPCWEPGTRCGYHAMSYGWLVGELVRRVTGRTVGQFFADNVARPLGLDLRIGTTPDDQQRVAAVVDRMRAGMPWPVRMIYPLIQRRVTNPATLSGKAYLAYNGETIVDRAETFFRHEGVLAAEIPSGNGTGTARSLARLYAMLSCGGEIDGVRIVSPESVRLFGTEVVRAPDALMQDLGLPFMSRLIGGDAGRSLGYLMNVMPPRELPHFGPNPRTFGHEGAGGQISFCDPDAGVAAAFLRSELSATPKAAANLVDVLYKSLGSG